MGISNISLPPLPPLFFFVVQVRSEVREERAGLGSVPVTLDKIEGLQRLQKRYHEVVEREKLKKRRLDHGKSGSK